MKSKQNIERQNKVLVTGGNGFIGSKIIKYYKQNNNNNLIHSLGTKDKSRTSVDKYFVLDISSQDMINKISETYDIIYHCSGSASVPHSVLNPADDFRINAVGTFNLLEYARLSNSKKFIFLSTVSVNGLDNQLPLTEESIKKPISPYGASKLCGENYCYVYHKCFGLDTRIARIYNVYGPGLNRLFISDLIKKIKVSNGSIHIKGDGKQIRDYVYISDLINALIKISKNGNPGQSYDICSGKPIHLDEIINHVVNIMGRNIKVDYDNIIDKGDIKEWFGNPSKINDIGYEQKVNLKDGLRKTIFSYPIDK